LKFAQFDRRASAASIQRSRFIQAKSQTFCPAPGFEKFIERGLYGLNFGLLTKAGLQLFACFAKDEPGAKVHGVARKLNRIRLFHGDPLRVWNATLNKAPGRGVESRGVVKDRAIFQGTEASIQMVETGVHEPERNHFHAESVGKMRVRFQLGPHAVCRPERTAGGIPESVSSSFKREIGRQFVDGVAMRSKPLTKVRLFSAPLRMKEPAENFPGPALHWR
jgi:hypothetical protein